MSLRVESFSVGPMENNLYLLLDDITHSAVVVDPSIQSEAALERARELEREGYDFAAIWNTHGHFDHIFDNARWKKALGVPISMHAADESFRLRLREQAHWFGFEPPEIVATDHFLTPGEVVNVGEHAATILHLPGHSPGSVAFYFAAQDLCIAGDVLFAGSVGRTDLPGASPAELEKSLAILFALPPQTRILPGHAAATTIAQEAATNPFCREILERKA